MAQKVVFSSQAQNNKAIWVEFSAQSLKLHPVRNSNDGIKLNIGNKLGIESDPTETDIQKGSHNLHKSGWQCVGILSLF